MLKKIKIPIIFWYVLTKCSVKKNKELKKVQNRYIYLAHCTTRMISRIAL